jgi:NAD(P)-dependent dehydrogenase (short-subunit alcohol dehydrogenase family)
MTRIRILEAISSRVATGAAARRRRAVDVTAPEIAGPSVLVTGASRGIGLSIADRFHSVGANVTITACNAEALEVAADELGGIAVRYGAGRQVRTTPNIADVFRQISSQYGRLHVLVLNVGIKLAYEPMLDIDLAIARKITEVNLVSTIGSLQAARSDAPSSLPKSIIIVSSVAGVRLAANIGFYGATKAALVHMSQQLASELAQDVRVNGVAPAVNTHEVRGDPLCQRGSDRRAVSAGSARRTRRCCRGLERISF